MAAPSKRTVGRSRPRRRGLPKYIRLRESHFSISGEMGKKLLAANSTASVFAANSTDSDKTVWSADSTHPDPENSGGGGRSEKNFFRLFGPQFGLKISGGAGGPSPGSATVHYIFSFYRSIIVPSNRSSHTYQSGSGFARFQALISPSLRRYYYGCWTVHTSLSSAHPQETKTR